jgi:hypothetical protein
MEHFSRAKMCAKEGLLKKRQVRIGTPALVSYYQEMGIQYE